MSRVNIKRAVENIKASTTVYTPVVEMVVNAIQAIDEARPQSGTVKIRARRSGQAELDGSLPEIDGFEIEDNGVGFTDAHRKSFDTLYTDARIQDGGKGFGRFTALKYFQDVDIRSIYCIGDAYKMRAFSMGKDTDIIVRERLAPATIRETGTVVTLSILKKGFAFEKKLSTVARNLVERLLPYFITDGYICPSVVLSEQDGTDAISLNDYVSATADAGIREISVASSTFTLRSTQAEETFLVRVFRIYSPRNQKSRVSLVAHKREVSGSALHRYIPEFEDEFCDNDSGSANEHERNYIIKAYVFSPYLDQHVSLERGGFEFQMETDALLGIAQTAIERQAAAVAKLAAGAEITSRQVRKRDRVQAYVDEEAPWHKTMMAAIDLADMPYKPTNEQIEARLQREKYSQELEIRSGVAKLLAESSLEKVQPTVVEIVSKISGNGKNDLIHYIALRKALLDLLAKSLEVDASGAYAAEGVVHDIIFPRRRNTETTVFQDHNLWILDERLNFTNYVSSDLPLADGNAARPDLLVYNKRVLFRGDNEASNPITVFEFKKPQRDDFANPSSHEDPIQQIVRYVIDIRDGKYKTPEGRKILIAPNTPCYGYVVCDITTKVEGWLEREKDFKPMPDRLGWFQWMANINLYVEVISWDKILRDAKMRSQVFFHKLGI